MAHANLYHYMAYIGDAGSDGEEEGGDVPTDAPPPKRSLSVKPKRKVKGRGGKKGGARRGKKGATAAARRVTPIPIIEEKEGIYIRTLHKIRIFNVKFLAPYSSRFCIPPPSSHVLSCAHTPSHTHVCTCIQTHTPFTYVTPHH